MPVMAKKNSSAEEAEEAPMKGLTVRLTIEELEQLDELTALVRERKKLGRVSRSDVIRAIFGWATPQALKDPSILES